MGNGRLKELFIIEGELPKTEAIPINRNCKKEQWKGCKIIQHGSFFRIHDSSKEGFTITIDSDDALYLIEELKLAATLDSVMRRVVIWMPND